jgi:hypothetical protein
MKRELDLSLRGICKAWAYGPMMDAVADGAGIAAGRERGRFMTELDELEEFILNQTPRRTTERIKEALRWHMASARLLVEIDLDQVPVIDN